MWLLLYQDVGRAGDFSIAITVFQWSKTKVKLQHFYNDVCSWAPHFRLPVVLPLYWPKYTHICHCSCFLVDTKHVLWVWVFGNYKNGLLSSDNSHCFGSSSD